MNIWSRWTGRRQKGEVDGLVFMQLILSAWHSASTVLGTGEMAVNKTDRSLALKEHHSNWGAVG